MSKINFYQVMNGETLKFSCQLLEKCYQNNIKTFVQLADEAMADTLNRMLWTFSQKSFIPHGGEKDPMPEKHPIYISINPTCPINASGLMLIGVERPDIKDYERVMVMIDGAVPLEVKKAEAFMAALTKLGHQVEYYLQNAKAGWDLRS